MHEPHWHDGILPHWHVSTWFFWGIIIVGAVWVFYRMKNKSKSKIKEK